MNLNPKQINEILELIDLHILKFINMSVGHSHLSILEKKILDANGIKLVFGGMSSIETVYRYGILSQVLDDAQNYKQGYSEFKKRVKGKKFLPLDFREKSALEALKFEAYNEIKGLGNKISTGTGRILIEVDKKQRARYENLISDKVKSAVIDRNAAKSLASELGHATKDWARDFDRLSDTVLHNAHEQGRAMGIIRMEGIDSLVYKRVFQPCSNCIRLYLTNGAGSQPRIFKLSVLLSNGTNIGVKVKEWKPVVGATHPWCNCQLEYAGENAVWDENDGKFKEVARSKRAKDFSSRIKINIR